MNSTQSTLYDPLYAVLVLQHCIIKLIHNLCLNRRRVNVHTFCHYHNMHSYMKWNAIHFVSGSDLFEVTLDDTLLERGHVAHVFVNDELYEWEGVKLFLYYNCNASFECVWLFPLSLEKNIFIVNQKLADSLSMTSFSPFSFFSFSLLLLSCCLISHLCYSLYSICIQLESFTE